MSDWRLQPGYGGGFEPRPFASSLSSQEAPLSGDPAFLVGPSPEQEVQRPAQPQSPHMWSRTCPAGSARWGEWQGWLLPTLTSPFHCLASSHLQLSPSPRPQV